MRQSRILAGDVLDVLPKLEAESVQCCVTSPPYWGLRDYGTAEWEDGEAGCDHVVAEIRTRGALAEWSAEHAAGGGHAVPKQLQAKSVCPKCGARRIDSQIGLEPTPEEYVAKLVEVFREVRRVLRPDGTLWLNLGDSYCGAPKGNPGSGLNSHSRALGVKEHRYDKSKVPGLKPKDLVGIPWRVAFALQADGWWLRSDIIWAKPNPMPESVTDRPTKSHEYMFLLAKGQWKSRVVEVSNLPGEVLHLGGDFRASSPNVWANEFCVGLATAIFDCAQSEHDFSLRLLDSEVRQKRVDDGDGPAVSGLPVMHRAAVWASRFLGSHVPAKEFLHELNRMGVALSDSNYLLIGDGAAQVLLPPEITRYGEGTVAIHHPGEVRKLDLVHNRIVSSTPSTCKYYFDAEAVRESSVDPDGRARAKITGRGSQGFAAARGNDRDNSGGFPSDAGRNIRSVWTIATQPYKEAHFATFPPALVEPCIKAGSAEGGTVLDPFAGSGTTGMVANRLNREFIGVELNPEYAKMAEARIRDDAPLFNEVTT